MKSYNELFELYKALLTLIANLKQAPVKLLYSLRKNEIILKQELEIIEKSFKPQLPEIEQLKDEHYNLLIKHGAKEVTDHQGTHIDSFDNLDRDAFQKEYTKLEKKYKKHLDEQDKINKENEIIRNEKCIDVELRKVSIDDFPKEIDAKLFSNPLLLIIEE